MQTFLCNLLSNPKLIGKLITKETHKIIKEDKQ